MTLLNIKNIFLLAGASACMDMILSWLWREMMQRCINCRPYGTPDVAYSICYQNVVPLGLENISSINYRICGGTKTCFHPDE